MGKNKNSRGSNEPVQNTGRKKANKKHPRTSPSTTGKDKATGRTVGGYSLAKLEIRSKKREGVYSSK